MAYCDTMSLISGSPVEIPQVCSVIPICLSVFKGCGGAARYHDYRRYLSLVVMTTDDIIKSLSDVGILGDRDKEAMASVTPFDLLTSIFREPFIEALSFFVKEELIWQQDESLFQCEGPSGELVGEISRETYPLVRRVIMESNFITADEEPEEKRFSGDKSRSIFEKLRAGRQKKKAAEAVNKGPDIEDIISSVSVRSNGYTLLNIWDLSIYQLYDQFMRINTNYQIDVYGLKWAAWGTEPFDFSLWYKNKEENNG